MKGKTGIPVLWVDEEFSFLGYRKSLSQFFENSSISSECNQPVYKLTFSYFIFLSLILLGAQFGERQGIFQAKARASTLSVLHALYAKFELKI